MSWDEVDYFPNREGGQQALRRDFEFPDFKSGLAFVNAVGELAEKLNHHPDINLSWGSVRVWTTSHDAHMVTSKDHALAKAIDQIYNAL